MSERLGWGGPDAKTERGAGGGAGRVGGDPLRGSPFGCTCQISTSKKKLWLTGKTCALDTCGLSAPQPLCHLPSASPAGPWCQELPLGIASRVYNSGHGAQHQGSWHPVRTPVRAHSLAQLLPFFMGRLAWQRKPGGIFCQIPPLSF